MAFLVLLLLFLGFPAMTLSSGTGETRTVPASPPAKTTFGRASLSIKSMSPLTVAGSGFKPGESVRISGAGTKRVAASRRGAFSVRLPGVDPCGSLTIVAVGTKGSRASMNFSQLLCVEE